MAADNRFSGLARTTRSNQDAVRLADADPHLDAPAEGSDLELETLVDVISMLEVGYDLDLSLVTPVAGADVAHEILDVEDVDFGERLLPAYLS